MFVAHYKSGSVLRSVSERTGMMVKQVNFSVVIALHNKEHTIVRAIDSVFCQTLPPKAVVVVDDGSTDDGLSRLSLSPHYPLITLVSQAQLGPGRARNAGWHRCSTEWVAFLDADDEWEPRHLAVLAHIVGSFQGVEWVSTASSLVMNSEILRPAEFASIRSLSYVPAEITGGKRAESRESYFDMARTRVCLPNSSSTAVRRDVLESVGGFADTLPNEDLALWCALAMRGDLGYSVSRTVAIHRGTNNITNVLRQQLSGTHCEDPFALSATPHVSRVANALETTDVDASIRRRAELYLDHLLLRHWPTVVIHGSQSCARQAISMVRRRRQWRYGIFIIVAYLPRPLARAAMHIGNWLLGRLRIRVPVSPFVHRKS